jgi:hypothetical protein
VLQRFFPSFPNGMPGIGLLLLRLTVGVALVVESAAILAERGDSLRGVGLGRGRRERVGSVVGVLTPAAGSLAALVNLAAAVVFPGLGPPWAFQGSPTDALVLVMATAIVLLGPGGFSVDARLFGRREIVVPRRSQRVARENRS